MSFREIDDFRQISDALAATVADLDADTLQTPTQFKQWRIADILGHLAIWNDAAVMTLQDPAAFQAFFATVTQALQGDAGLRDFENRQLAGRDATEIRDLWQHSYAHLVDAYRGANPKQRVQWGGPDMSVRSCVSARLMETWAHGQAIYDVLGRERTLDDSIYSIVMLGNNTFEFNFRINGLTPPARPRLELTAPSGATWRLNEDSDSGRIAGSAGAFCQVVTQVRHVDDTDLEVEGDAARQWMAIAQCFAGPPHPPPQPGTRFRA